MVEFRLLADDYNCCSWCEKIDRDNTALEMVQYLCERFFDGGVEDTIHVLCSFFSLKMYYDCLKYLETSGIRALCRVEVGHDRIIRVWLVKNGAPLWNSLAEMAHRGGAFH